MKMLTMRFGDIKKSKSKIKDSFELLRSVYTHGKVVELFSFAVWEVLYFFGLLKKIKFTNDLPIVLDQDFNNLPVLIDDRFSLNIRRTYCWSKIYLLGDSFGYGSLFTSPFDLYFIKGTCNPKKIYHFEKEIYSIFVSRIGTIFVCLNGGDIYRRSDGGESFHVSLSLSTNESVFLFNYGMTETNDNTLLIGEYGNVSENQRWKAVAYIYRSNDNGISWESSDFLIKQGVNKHVHIIKYIKRINAVIVSNGDNKKQIWQCFLPNQKQKTEGIVWRLINKFHIQTGGYMSVIETKDKIIFGTDYQGGTNFIIESNDCERFIKFAIPDPYRRSPIFYMSGRMLNNDCEIWALLVPCVEVGSKGLLMCSRDQGKSWIKVIEYDGLKYDIKICSAFNNTMYNEVYFSVTSFSCSCIETRTSTFVIR
jgi:hypothetical protein